jgi:hypothetical protein
VNAQPLSPLVGGEPVGRRVSVGHAELYVEEYGEGEPLLLVAGLGGSGRFWMQQVPESRGRPFGPGPAHLQRG